MANNPVRNESTKIVALPLSAEEITAGLKAAPQALATAASANSKSDNAVTRSLSALSVANESKTIATTAKATAESVVKRANAGEFKGEKGDTALYYNVALDYGTDPVIGNQYSSEYKYFSRQQISVGEIFYIIGINNKFAIFFILAEVLSTTEYVNYVVKETLPLTELTFNEFVSYSTSNSVEVGETHEIEFSKFNRTPIKNETLKFFGYVKQGENKTISYTIRANIIEVDAEKNIAKYQILDRVVISKDDEEAPLIATFNITELGSTSTPYEEFGSIIRLTGLINATKIDWGDGTIEAVDSSFNATHEYLEIGEYQCKIYGITEIGAQGFVNPSSRLISITLPNGLKKIGERAFGTYSDRPTLTEINIPETVVSIGAHAFEGWTYLENIIIPNSVKEIGECAFKGCYSLKSLIIPNSVKEIGVAVLQDCTSLTSLTVPFVGNRAGVTSEDAHQYPFGYIFGGSNGSDDSETATIQHFYDDSPTSIKVSSFFIPNSLKKVIVTGGDILHGAFMNCSNLTSIETPTTATAIRGQAFYGCNNLIDIKILGDIKEIGSNAFQACDKLTSITIPNSVIHIRAGAFYSCDALKSVTIGESLTSIESQAFYLCSSLTNITIPNSITSIGAGAFRNCRNLKSVIIGNSITSIGDGVFSAESLRVEINSDTPPTIGNDAFASSTKIIVPYSLLEAYKTSWSEYVDMLDSYILSSSFVALEERVAKLEA